MDIEQNRHTSALRNPVALTIAQSRAQQHRLAIIRLLGTAIIGASLLTISAIHAKATDTTDTKDKATTQQKTKQDAQKKTAEAANKDGLPAETKAEKSSTKPAASEQSEPPKPTAVTDKQESTEPEATEKVAKGLVLPDYLDDRSTPQKLLESYYNAINRKEYARAYSYYAEGQLGTDFEDYAKGYEGTQSVLVKLGSSEPDPGAGQIYWSVPIAIESTLAEGKSQVYTGCYTISMSNPAMQTVPPFKPMAIMAGTLSKSPLPLDKSVPEECGAP